MPQFRVIQGPRQSVVLTGLSAGLLPDAWLLEPIHDNITALAGGAQVGATQLQGEFCRVATVVSAGDSVTLPDAIAGLDILVLNDSLNPMSVFPNGTDTIDAAPVNTSVSQMQKSFVFYVCVTQGVWRSIDLSTGFDPVLGLQTVSAQDGITAAGASQGTATPVNKLINNVPNVASGTGVILPPSSPGLVMTVNNNQGTNALLIYPNGSEKINALAASAGFSAAANTLTILYCFTAGQWFTK